MKKKLLGFVLVLFCFFPTLVNATEVNVKLDCPKTTNVWNSSKNVLDNNVNCTIKADISGGTLKKFSSSIIASGSFSSSNEKINKDGEWGEGNDLIIGQFNLIASGEPVTSTISIANFEGIDSENNAVTFVNSSVSKEVKVLNNDSSLESLKVDGVLVNGFSDKAYEYTQSIKKREVTIEAVATVGKKTKIIGNGSHNLKCGSNTFDILAQAESGRTTKYTLNLNRICWSDPNLKMITLSSGALKPSFDPKIKEYTVEVSTDIDKIGINVVKGDKTQYLNGDFKGGKLDYGANTFKINVEAENGAKTTYTIVVNRKDGRNTNNELEDLTLDYGKIDFNRELLLYNTKVLFDVESIKVDAIPVSKTSKVEITGNKDLKVGENTIIIKVTSEKGESKEYKIIVDRLKEGETLGDNANIKDIIIKDYDLGFEINKKDYYLKIDNEKELIIDIIMEDETSNFNIEGNNNLKDGSIISIYTKSLDGSREVYKITIEKDNDIMFVVLGVISFLIAAGLIVYFVIKNKKVDIDKPKKVKKEKDTKKVKTNVVTDDKNLMEKVERQLKEVQEKKNLEKASEVIDLTDRKISDGETKVAEEKQNPFIDLRKHDEDNSLVKEEKEKVQVQEKEEDNLDYKICTICGHKVPKNAKVCPYCKRTWE